MSVDTIALLVLLAALGLLYVIKRKNFKTQRFLIFYFSTYRTKLGMKLMNALGKPWLKKLGWPMIITCFLGMALMIEELIRGIIKLFSGSAGMTVGVVLPVQAKGVFYVPFFYWILAITFIMVVHELAHGVIARAHKTKIKSTGFAFLGALIPIIPGAFVEIDEKHLTKKSLFAQLSIFSAGPFTNMVFGALFLAVLGLVFAPITNALYEPAGVKITKVSEESPAAFSGFAQGEIIKEINGQQVRTTKDFDKAFTGVSTGTQVNILTDKATHVAVYNEKLGVTVQQHAVLSKTAERAYGKFLPAFLLWLSGLVYWLFLLNLGVGLFNLVPLGPIDGGRMLHTVLCAFLHKKHAQRVWHAVSAFMLAIITSTIVYAFVG